MIYRFASCELDESAGELRRDGQPVGIQPKPMALLTLLIEERHRIVPTDELLERLWPEATVTPGSLSRAVSVARSAIGDSGRSGYIRSYNRRGYRFHGDVVELESGVPAAAEPADGQIPFVGRDEALAQLRGIWQRALGGRDAVALVRGPAGIGKTRLTEVFEQEVARRGGLALRGRALEDEGEPAFWVWAQVLRTLLREDPQSLAVPGLADSGELAALMPELDAEETSAAAQLPAEQRRFVFFDAVARVLRHAARRRPLLVIFEDLHWADAASLRLLEHLAFELHGAPVMLLATLRDAPPIPNDPSLRAQHVLRRHDRYADVELGKLGSSAVEQLVEQVIGRPHQELATRLLRWTDGVPLFLREAWRQLGKLGALENSDLLKSKPGAELPVARTDWVARAMEALSDRCAGLVGAASVLGREFALPLAAAAAQVPREEALDLLDEAVLAGIVEPDPEGPARYRFVHDLFREAAYAGLAPGLRVRLHHRVATQLERQHGLDADRVIGEVAHHYHRALAVADPERAFAAAARAAECAFGACAYERSALHRTQALAALDHVESANPERRLSTLLDLGEASRLSGERERRQHYFGEAMELARRLDRPEAFASAAIGLCDLAEWGVRDDLARSALEEASRRLGRPEAELEAKLLTRLGYLDAMFDREAAERRLRRAVQIARQLAASDPLEEALYALHLVLGGPDGRSERREVLAELRGAASAARDPVASVIAVLDAACDRLEEGDASAAAELRREADATAGTPPHPRTIWHRLVYDAGLALLEGRFEEVGGLTEAALELGRRLQHPYARGCFVAQRTSLHAVRGEHAEVVELLEPALRARQGPVHWVRLVLARARLAMGDHQRALALYEEAVSQGAAAIPRNLRWMSTLVELSHCCAELGDADRALDLIEILRPYETHHGVMPMVVAYGGPVSFALARLCELIGRADEADELFAEALVSANEMSAHPTRPHIHLCRGRLLERRGQRSAAREQRAAAASLASQLGLDVVERKACQALGAPAS